MSWSVPVEVESKFLALARKRATPLVFVFCCIVTEFTTALTIMSSRYVAPERVLVTVILITNSLIKS